MPTPDDAARLREFFGGLLSGAAKFGMSALPLIKVYEKAQKEGVDFWELLMTDEGTSKQIIDALKRHVEKLPPHVFTGLKLVLDARNEVEIRKKQEAEALAKSKAAHRSAPASTGRHFDPDV